MTAERESVCLDLIAAHEIPLQLQSVHRRDVPILDEAMISSSSRGLLPVVCIGDQVVGNGQPGPITQKLSAAYNVYVAAHLQTALEA